jgi:hypothetical protein
MNDRSAMPSHVLGAEPASVERRATTSSLGLLALSIAPLAIWLVPFLNRERIGPFYLIGRVDPSYIYLLNSFLVSCGKNPRHIDHPGTPLQIVGALALGVGPAASNFRYFESELPRRHAQDRSDTEKIRRIAADRCGSLIPQTNGVSSQLSGLLFGNIFAEKFDLQLAKLYPDFVSYHVGDRFYGFTGRDGVNPPVDPGGKPICIFGTIELPATDAQKFRLVAREGYYRLYVSE